MSHASKRERKVTKLKGRNTIVPSLSSTSCCDYIMLTIVVVASFTLQYVLRHWHPVSFPGPSSSLSHPPPLFSIYVVSVTPAPAKKAAGTNISL